jgi:Double zinc ribbon
MKRPRCHHQNEAGAKFCEECAAPLARVCAKCSRPLSRERPLTPRHPAPARGAWEQAEGAGPRRAGPRAGLAERRGYPIAAGAGPGAAGARARTRACAVSVGEWVGLLTDLVTPDFLSRALRWTLGTKVTAVGDLELPAEPSVLSAASDPLSVDFHARPDRLR